MANPTLHDVHIDQPLTAISVAYTNNNYIAEQVFPRVKVDKKSDYYFVFPKDAWYRDDVEIRAPGTRSAEADYDITTASYVCVTRAISKLVPDEVRLNADQPLAPDTEATNFVMDALMRAQERRVATKVMTNGNWAYGASPTTQWSSDTSDPLGDIENAVNGVVSVIGRQPNIAVMSWETWRKLRNHPDLLERIKYTRPGGKPLTNDLADWFGFDKVLVGSGIYNASREGVTFSGSYIWGKAFWCGYVPNAPALMTPAAGYILEWQGRTIKRFRRDEEYTDKIEASHSTAEVISASDSGALIYDAVA